MLMILQGFCFGIHNVENRNVNTKHSLTIETVLRDSAFKKWCIEQGVFLILRNDFGRYS